MTLARTDALEPFTTFASVAVPIDIPNCDTDQIIPARFLRRAVDDPEYAKFLFHDLRFNADGSEKDFVFNKEPYRHGRIFVADVNWGCGSSRENAVNALDANGVRCVIAPSFGDIHFSNCIKNGILPVRLSSEACETLRRQLRDNPGAEIAVDLIEHGAEAAICIRGPIHFVARDLTGGVPAQIVGIALSRLPVRLADSLAVMTSKMMFGDLSSFGVRRPEMGPITQIRTLGRVPLIDVGTIELIRNGKLPVFPGIERFYDAGVELVDGRREAFDAVVLATGYQATLDEFLDDAESHLNERGYPKLLADEADHPGPYFIGFGNPPTGLLREINHQAKAVAAKIAAANQQ